jgi:predicted GNAT family acetyltransferase
VTTAILKRISGILSQQTPSTGVRSESYEARNRLFDPFPGRFSREKYLHLKEEDYVMTIGEVEALIKTKTRNKVRIHVLEERVGDSVAFLSYSIDDKNQMTVWHTEVPPPLQHLGIGGKLVEEAVQLASRDSSRLRIVCPFAKQHLARHPELKERYAVRLEETSPVRGLHPNL